MFGRPARSPVDVILGIPYEGHTADTEELAQQTRGDLQIAFELARRNLSGRTTKQTARNDKLPLYPVFHPHQQVVLCRRYQDSDGPKPKLLLPWRWPYVICSQLTVTRGKHEKYPWNLAPLKNLPSAGNTTSTSI